METITGEYRIIAERENRLVRIAFLGFWDSETMSRFIKDEQAAVASLGCPAGEHLVLADVSSAVLQSQGIVSAFRAFISGAQFKASRLAFVTGNSALRMQARRLLLRPGFAVAATIEEAEAFLFARDLPAVTKMA